MSGDEQSKGIFLHVEIDHRINFAMQQNDIPTVKSIRIENRTEIPLEELSLRIIGEPDFSVPWETLIDRVPEDSSYKLEAVNLNLSPNFLAGLTERIRGRLCFELFSSGEKVAEQIHTVELLARDEWGGLSSLPEILAAFVTPNHAVVSQILGRASDLLKEWTGDSAISGYQTKSATRVWMITAAIYGAIQNLGLRYVNPPASFETEGQRVRLPGRIMDNLQAACLDLSVLTAACLEQAGLHPLIILVTGHAFAGVWLVEECFGESALDDCLRLRKRVDLNEIGIFDPTCITASPPLDFDLATGEARRQLANPGNFNCLIDIKRARRGKIRPLPENLSPPSVIEENESEGPRRESFPLSAPKIPETMAPIIGGLEETETAESRIERWQRRLLDLTLRNRLLNFKNTKKTIPLLCPDLAAFEDYLAGGAIFGIQPRPMEMAAADPRDPDSFRRRTGDDAVETLLREDLLAKSLHADLPRKELDRRLLEIYRAARLGLEEGGASALFLAVGFLLWYESPTSQTQRLAPILLLPVELNRKSAQEGFALKLSEEEIRVNVTLLELLKKDHGIIVPGMDPLPEDESGLDVPRILRAFREKIRDIDRWDVLEVAHIGIFSFAKFLMWRDLTERAADLLINPVVGHLVNRPDQAFDPEATFPDPAHLDDEKSPLDTFCPLPADASQLAAIFAAEDGRSFVLEGPPGTGKSQTIANLVAHCLARGKSILFVSEKMAALNVVRNRLRHVGLGDYCLELHSQKSSKSEVLGQLGEALSSYESFPSEEWEREAKRLAALRQDLNDYVRALHKRRSTGETIFKAISVLIGLRGAPLVQLVWPSPDHFDVDGLCELRERVDSLATVGSSAGEVCHHPFAAVGHEDWNPAWENGIATALADCLLKVGQLQQAAAVASKRLSFADAGWNRRDLKIIAEVSRLLLESPGSPDALMIRPDWDEIQSGLDRWIEHGRARDALRMEVLERFTEKFTLLDLDDLQARHLRATVSSWPLSWWRIRPVKKALRGVAKDGQAPDTETLTQILMKALQLKEEEKALSNASDEARVVLGRFWNDGEARWDDLAGLRDWASRFRMMAVQAAGDDLEIAGEYRKRWAHLATEGRDLLKPDAAIGRELVEYGKAYADYLQAMGILNERLELDQEKAWGSNAEKNFLEKARQTLQTWSAGLSGLSGWCAWLRTRAAALASGLSPLIEAYENGDLTSGDLRRAFEYSYYKWWYSELVSREKVLAHFFSPEHEKKIELFQNTDEKYTGLTQRLVAARLAEKVPVSNGTNMSNSEMGILKREIAKKRRQMPVRKLLRTIPNLLPRLKPCLLMSPISVAQYLDAAYPPFDLVVFDEASQIPVWDAVGAIARGKSAVIVGDPKQLPPTAFFQRTDDDDDEAVDYGLVEDLESILEECISAQLPLRSLQWHYRSRHESLIAFSNHHYYQNRLLTFPSPLREGIGVQWRYIPGGLYDRGKSSTNRAEADAVVEEIVRRLKDAELSRLSIGVVTFSVVQQTLIEDLLEEVRRDNEDIDYFFSEDIPERIFIKNLENVQGDERDVILFSVCYGPDIHGKVTMNFGPMNRDGGERRLNVAITRARREVVVFSSLRADQIDLSRSRARGVRDLRNFLEYANRGTAALAENIQYDPEADFDSPFEKAVHDALIEKGWMVHLQVGCARYRIDLAVVDSESPGRYLLGIECDGANYHRAKAARDRDKLRENVLKDLGWRLHRIWSTDWWKNPQQELEKLEARLKEAMETCPAYGVPKEKHSRPKKSVAAPNVRPAQPMAAFSTTTPLVAYQPYQPESGLSFKEDFYAPVSMQPAQEMIADILRLEGPISLRLLTSRVVNCWGVKRVTQKAQSRILEILPKDKGLASKSKTGTFLWSADARPEEYREFRVPRNGEESVREAEDLPVEEVANAVIYVLRTQVSAPVEEIIRETSRLFGFRRSGRIVKERIADGLALLERQGRVKVEDDAVVINGD